MIEPFFWGRSGKINCKFTTGEILETYKFYQKNLYEEMIYSWFYNKNISILDDLNNIERFSFKNSFAFSLPWPILSSP